MKTINLHPDDIEIGERHRALSDDAVQRLAGSMKEIGLKQPISIRVVEMMVIDGQEVEGVPVLVAGAHRLAAAKALAWEGIDCIEVDDDAIAAELWEIAENLHRCDLTKDQRDQHIRRYAQLLEDRHAAQQVLAQNEPKPQPKPNGRPATSVARQIAEETGLSKSTVQRALNPPPKPTPRPQLVEVKDDFDVIGAQADAIVRAWNRACPEARAMAMEQIEGPVFDRTAAAR